MNVVGANMGIDPPFERAGMDRLTRFDAFISSQKLYVFMDGMPAGCTTYPADFALTGMVTVTFGDVLYHETADESAMNPRLMSFIQKHQFSETTRRFDDLAFKSGVQRPLRTRCWATGTRRGCRVAPTEAARRSRPRVAGDGLFSGVDSGRAARRGERRGSGSGG